MRIAFNARLLHAPELRGWNRYASNLLAALPPLGVRPVLYSDRPVHESHLARLPEGGYELRVSPRMPYPLWEQVWLPRQCARDGVDLLHTPFHYGLPWSCPCPKVLTLHDAIDHAFHPPYGGPGRRWSRETVLGRLYQWVARERADRIVTVSEHAKNDLVTVLGLPPDRITVVAEAADPRFHGPVPEEARQRVRRKYGLTLPYVFYVGGWEARKNLPLLVRGFATASLGRTLLVLAGGRDDERDSVGRLAVECAVPDRVRRLGWVDDADLPALYAEALAFVNPSVYEGFGLQLCEAMAVGCPTLAARATSLPEVLGSGGETFDPSDPSDLAAHLRRLVADPDHWAKLARRAKARSADFSWSRTAEGTVAVYRSAVGHAIACHSHVGAQ
jgi:glycosyltransferase involved in cell wall biosynthesis